MSRLITREQADMSAQPFVSLNLCDVEQQAREAVERARAEVKLFVAEATVQARQMEEAAAIRGRQAGYDAGFITGQEAGRAEALKAQTDRIQKETATVREALIEVLSELEKSRHELLSHAKEDLLHLAISLAERICRCRFEQSTDHVRPLLTEVIETTGRQSGLVVRVNPADAQAAQEFIADLQSYLPSDQSAGGSQSSLVRLVVDERVRRGGCLAERVNGRIDATVETQICRIVSELTGLDAGAMLVLASARAESKAALEAAAAVPAKTTAAPAAETVAVAAGSVAVAATASSGAQASGEAASARKRNSSQVVTGAKV